jgi:tRNA (guanine37-N1)-methyltransferase
VPQVLLEGNHQVIEAWRRREALRRTWKHRPDLLAKAKLSREDLKFIESLAERPDEDR